MASAFYEMFILRHRSESKFDRKDNECGVCVLCIIGLVARELHLMLRKRLGHDYVLEVRRFPRILYPRQFLLVAGVATSVHSPILQHTRALWPRKKSAPPGTCHLPLNCH
jgi:hypothetical protein